MKIVETSLGMSSLRSLVEVLCGVEGTPLRLSIPSRPKCFNCPDTQQSNIIISYSTLIPDCPVGDNNYFNPLADLFK